MPASAILMIRPAAFGYNEETAADNFFQSETSFAHKKKIHESALHEFDHMVRILRDHNIEVIVIDDTPSPSKPSAVFPNNWLCTSPEGKLFVFPMSAPSRRAERRDDIIRWISEHFIVTDFQDWSEFEAEGYFLEGTGSMVIDHDNKIIYACLSPRTSLPVLQKFAEHNGYQAITFLARDINGKYIYHTNVLLCIGEEFAIVCAEAIEEEWERIAVLQLLESTGHQIIRISFDQLHRFAGNMLLVKNNRNENLLVMSQTACDSLTPEQKELLSAYAGLLPIDVSVIEKAEGGSVRCMMAEIFLKQKNDQKATFAPAVT